jgi:hypothetical protein
MRYTLLNSEGREMESWDSLQALIDDLLHRAEFLEPGDQILVHDTDDRLLDDIIFQSKRH